MSIPALEQWILYNFLEACDFICVTIMKEVWQNLTTEK
jgi:hypothetical protein